MQHHPVLRTCGPTPADAMPPFSGEYPVHGSGHRLSQHCRMNLPMEGGNATVSARGQTAPGDGSADCIGFVQFHDEGSTRGFCILDPDIAVVFCE